MLTCWTHVEVTKGDCIRGIKARLLLDKMSSNSLCAAQHNNNSHWWNDWIFWNKWQLAEVTICSFWTVDLFLLLMNYIPRPDYSVPLASQPFGATKIAIWLLSHWWSYINSEWAIWEWIYLIERQDFILRDLIYWYFDSVKHHTFWEIGQKVQAKMHSWNQQGHFIYTVV